MLFIGSPTPRLPAVTVWPPVNHRKSIPTASHCFALALMDVTEWDDFDFMVSQNSDSCSIYECYPDAFERKYSRSSGSVYALDPKEYHRKTVITENGILLQHKPMAYLAEMDIYDAYASLMCERNCRRVILHPYSNKDSYQVILRNHLIDRIYRFHINVRTIGKEDPERFKCHRDILFDLI